MARKPFDFSDICKDCTTEEESYTLETSSGTRSFGLKIFVPEDLINQWPYNSSAYGFMQQLRKQVFEYGIIEFPGLPLNACNHTLAQRSPQEHNYSSNTYLTDYCQSPHQDTPPYPTAFWLPAQRQFFATWLLSDAAAEHFYQYRQQHAGMSIDDVHRQLVPESMDQGTGLLVNREPGLLIMDNSEHHRLYHARTCLFDAVAIQPEHTDTPMYAFSEPGLLHYIDTIDCRRGSHDNDAEDWADVQAFLAAEGDL